MKRKSPDRLVLPVSERDHIQGPEHALLTLLEYGDYQCPYCGEAHESIKEVQGILGEQLRFVFRNFPLTDVHPHAKHAAEAAEAAGAQGRFWEMHDTLYENQDALDDEDLAQYAEALGLDAGRLLREVQSGVYTPRIQEDFTSGMRSGVDGTPVFFINDVRYEGEYDPETLVAALTRVRARAA